MADVVRCFIWWRPSFGCFGVHSCRSSLYGPPWFMKGFF
eukprot:Gb_24442 [translate_table: standard]